MKCNYEQITTQEGHRATTFDISTRKGQAHGLYTLRRIWVHGIYGEGSVKSIIEVLINRFKTNKITFTPLINDNIKNSIRGDLKVCRANDPSNPYGEDFEYLECEWSAL